VWIDQRGSEILPHSECLRLLAVAAQGHHIGRLGVSTPTSPIIVPVNFAYHNAGVICRIGPGTLAEKAKGSLVAFEVDRMDEGGRSIWSVLLRGLARELSNDEISGLKPQELPVPAVRHAGELVIFVRGDVITGRRFSVGDPTSSADVGKARVE
jgi:hypothetical protein